MSPAGHGESFRLVVGGKRVSVSVLKFGNSGEFSGCGMRQTPGNTRFGTDECDSLRLYSQGPLPRNVSVANVKKNPAV